MVRRVGLSRRVHDPAPTWCVPLPRQLRDRFPLPRGERDHRPAGAFGTGASGSRHQARDCAQPDRRDRPGRGRAGCPDPLGRRGHAVAVPRPLPARVTHRHQRPRPPPGRLLLPAHAALSAFDRELGPGAGIHVGAGHRRAVRLARRRVRLQPHPPVDSAPVRAAGDLRVGACRLDVARPLRPALRAQQQRRVGRRLHRRQCAASAVHLSGRRGCRPGRCVARKHVAEADLVTGDRGWAVGLNARDRTGLSVHRAELLRDSERPVVRAPLHRKRDCRHEGRLRAHERDCQQLHWRQAVDQERRAERPGHCRQPEVVGLHTAQGRLRATADNPYVLQLQRHRHRPVHSVPVGHHTDGVHVARNQRTGARREQAASRGTELGQRAPPVHARIRRRRQPGQRGCRRGPARLHRRRPATHRHPQGHRAGHLLRRAHRQLRACAIEHARVRLPAGKPGRVHHLHRQPRCSDDPGQPRPVGPQAGRFQPTRVTPGDRQERDALPPQDPRPRAGAGSLPNLRPGPVRGRRRRPRLLDPRRVHDRLDLPLLAVEHLPAHLHQPLRHQLRPQLGEGRDRRLRRHRRLLRDRPQGPDHQCLPGDLSVPLQADRRDAGRAPGPPAGTGRPVRRPGRNLRDLSHHRPQGVLRARGRMGHPNRADGPGKRVHASAAVLRAVSVAR